MSQFRNPIGVATASILLLSLSSCQKKSEDEAMPAAAAAPAAMAYVSNQEGAISVIDLAKLETVGEIETGASSPRGIAITEDGKLLITANRDQGNISLIDRLSGKLAAQIEIGKNPEFVRVRGDFAFVSFEPTSEGGPPPAEGSPEALKQEKEKKERAEGHAAGGGDDDDKEPAQIAVVNLSKREVVRRITGGLETEGIEFSANGQNLLITNEADDSITVHEIATGKQIKRIDTTPHGPRPRGIKMAPDGKSYVATLEHGNKLLVLDENFDPVRSVPTGNVPYGVTYDRKGERLYVALAHGKALQVFDGKTLAPIKEVPTGTRCWHFSFTPDDSKILVACGRSNEVVVIDAATLTEVKRIEDKKLPWGIVTWPKSVGSLDWPG